MATGWSAVLGTSVWDFILHPSRLLLALTCFCSYNLQMSQNHFTCRQSLWKGSFKHTFTECDCSNCGYAKRADCGLQLSREPLIPASMSEWLKRFFLTENQWEKKHMKEKKKHVQFVSVGATLSLSPSEWWNSARTFWLLHSCMKTCYSFYLYCITGYGEMAKTTIHKHQTNE